MADFFEGVCSTALFILVLGIVLAFSILCVGAAWWLVKMAWQFSF